MARVSDFLRRHHAGMDYQPAWESQTRLANRRRLLVFTGVFAAACVLSLGFTFLRPPEYRALALLQITPGAAAPRPIETVSGQSAAPAAESDKPFLTEVQVLEQPARARADRRASGARWSRSLLRSARTRSPRCRR